MKNKSAKIILIIFVILTGALGFYAFVISSPKEIFLRFFGDEDEQIQVVNNDNINGIYKYSEPLNKFYLVYTGCRVDSKDYIILIMNDNYYQYKTSCIATYLIKQGKTSDLKIEYEDKLKQLQVKYDNKTYVKTNETKIVPGVKVLSGSNTETLMIDTLKLVLQEIKQEDQKLPDIDISSDRSTKIPFSFHFYEDPADSFHIYFVDEDADDRPIIATYDYIGIEKTPQFYVYSKAVGVLINRSTETRRNYTLEVITRTGVTYKLIDEFPITINNEVITPEDYNVYIKRNAHDNSYSMYLSKYYDYCLDDKDSDQVIYYEFKITYNSPKHIYNKPEYVGKRMAKEGCNTIIEEE